MLNEKLCIRPAFSVQSVGCTVLRYNNNNKINYRNLHLYIAFHKSKVVGQGGKIYIYAVQEEECSLNRKVFKSDLKMENEDQSHGD